MTKIQKSPVLEVAVRFLREHIDRNNWKNGERLPTYSQLAKQAGVGAITMWKAIAILKKEKKISFKKGAGIYVGDKIHLKSESVSAPKVTRWTIVAEQLRKDILSDMFHDHEFLPLSKELCEQYGVHYLTLKKALDELIKGNVLAWHKRKYRILGQKNTTPTKSLCLILSKSVCEMQMLKPSREIAGEFIDMIEKECAQKNIRLIKHCFGDDIDAIVNNTSIQGFIVWICLELHQRAQEIINSIRKFNKPIVVADLLLEIGKETNVQLVTREKSLPPVFVCDTTVDYRAGLTMGRFLVKKGYLKACFISHVKPEYSYEDRFNGVRKAFEESGCINAVTQVSIDNLSEKEKEDLLCDNDRIFETSRKKENVFLNKFQMLIQKNIRQSYATRAALTLHELYSACDCRTVYTPAFRKALAIQDATVWIFTNDHPAINGAFEFLQDQGLHVPKDIGLVGFDDFFESKICNLTTWHFDFAGAARRAIKLALYPEYAGKVLCNKGTNVFDIDGYVVDRGSV